MLFEAALQLVLLPVIVLFGTIGLYAHYIGTRLLALGARMVTTPFGVRARYLPKRVQELVVTGFPIMLSGYVFGVFQVADKTYVALNMTPAELGLYSVGNLIFLGVGTLPLAIAAMDYSRMAKAFGESEDLRRLIPFVTQGIAKAVLLAAAVAVPTSIVLEPAVTFGLPEYRSALPAIQVMLATSVVSAAFISGNVFAVVRRSMEYNLYLVLAIAGTLVGCWLAERMALGLVGIAAAKLVVTVIAAVAVALRAYALLRSGPSPD
jgi:O-antigen/teichoic acid export membrane protein